MSTTGHEEEFRRLFAEEAEQRLGDLGSQLIALEAQPNDPELIASIFREAHTLKGAAAVVGIDEMRVVAHAMENLLEDLRSGRRVATPELIDGLLASVDSLQALLPALVAGEDRMTVAHEVEAALLVASELETSSEPSAAVTLDPGPIDDPDSVIDRYSDGDRTDTAGATESTSTPGTTALRTRETETAETARVPLIRLDEIVRLVGESAAAHLRVGRMVNERLGSDPGTIDEIRELSRVLNELQALAMRARMVPVATITDMLQRAVRDVSRATGKEVRWEVLGEETELDRGVLEQLRDPLLHIVRNAVDHGIETGPERIAAGKPEQGSVRFHAMQLGSEVTITITDDGRGIDVDRIRTEAARHEPSAANLSDDEALYLVFRSGFSTAKFVSDISGRGVGLDVVRSNVESVRGRIQIHNEPGAGTEFRINVPITLAILPCLMVQTRDQRYAIPMSSVVVVQAESSLVTSEGRSSIWVGNQAVPLSGLGETIGGDGNDDGPIVVVSGLTRRHAFRVTSLLGQRDVVVKGLSRLLPRIGVLAGASVEPDGSILFVLDVPGLIDRARRARGRAPTTFAAPETTEVPAETHLAPMRARILVVDDARTVRELQRSILQRAGYDVLTAADGVEAMAQLAEGPVDLVMTDVEMPRMNGFELTESIRADPANSNVPVLILTSLASDEDRQRGLLAGADGYIIKSAFDETALIAAVDRLLGR